MSNPVASALPAEIESRRADIARICARLGVRRLELFGSGTRSASPRDLDFLAGLANPYFRQRVEQEKILLHAA